MDKQEVLQNAEKELNRDDRPWKVHIEGDTIVGVWKWADARFFGTQTVSDEYKVFEYRATLKDNGKYKEKMTSKEQEAGFDWKSGKISFGNSNKRSVFQYEKTIGIGKNKETGETGIIETHLDSREIAKPIREYLERCGYKKAGIFG